LCDCYGMKMIGGVGKEGCGGGQSRKEEGGRKWREV
jgi:hypothetical protein